MTGFGQWLASSGRAEATAEGYLKHCGWLAADTSDPWALTSVQLQTWLDDHNWSAGTRRKVLVSLRCFYAWGVAQGECRWAPTAGVATSEPRKRGSRRNPVPPGWVEPLTAFQQWLQASGRTEGTIEQRRWWLSRLAEVCADPWEVSAEQLALWLSTPDWSSETKRAGRASVRSFYRWAALTGRVQRSPAADLDSVKLRRALPRPTPASAVLSALHGADDRARLAIMLAAYAGLRRAEIAELHWHDVGEGEVLVHGKGGVERMVPLHPDLEAELGAELRRRRIGGHGTGWSGTHVSRSGWVFPSDIEDKPLTPAHLGKIISRCLPDGWTTHSLRHRFATAAYRADRDLRAVQELLGHSKPETTARYAAVPDGALRSAVAGVGLD